MVHWPVPFLCEAPTVLIKGGLLTGLKSMKKPKSRKEELRDKRERAVEKERYEALDYVCRMHEEGARFISVGQIAAHFGRSRMAVRSDGEMPR